MKDSNEKDQLRFDKLYKLLGDEINQVYEENHSIDNNSIANNEENISLNAPIFDDVFNIFNNQNSHFNNEAFIKAVNQQETIRTNNDEYLQELNNIMNNYNDNCHSTNNIFKEETDIFNVQLSDNIITQPNNENLFNNNVALDNVDIHEDNQNNNENINISIGEENINDNEAVTQEEITQNEEENIAHHTKIIDEDIFIEPTKIEVNNKINQEIEKRKESNEYNFENKNKIRNQTIISSKNMYDDGLDEIYHKKTIMDILTDRKIIHILLFVIFIVMVILVIKAFHFGKLVDIYNEYTTETSKTNANDTKIYDDKTIDIETLKKAAAGELIDCVNSQVDTNKLPSELNSIIKEINDYYRSSGKYFAFAYKDLFTGFTVSYNENGNIFAASTIKAPVNIYLYEMASQGKVNLDDELTYTGNYYNNGTGVLKNKPINTNYSIRTLSEYAIRNSDNAAHNMLMDKYGRSNIKKYWQDKGTSIILTGNDNWGLLNAHDAMIYMKELYTFYINNNEYGNELMTNFLTAKTKFITGKNNYRVANKTGWSGNSQHDVAIVFADNPYIVVALSNLGYDNDYMVHFNKVNELANKLHNEYWKYKMNICANIKQYD